MADIPAQKTKTHLESLGWHVDFCNRWLMGANVRKDFFGLGDLGAIRHDFKGTWYINACGIDKVNEHIKAYLDGGVRKSGKRCGEPFPPNPHLSVLLCGNRFSIFGWGLRSSDGRGSRKIWQFKVWEAYLKGSEPKFKQLTEEPICC